MTEPHLDAQAAVMSDGARLPLRAWRAAAPTAIAIGVHGHNNYSMEFEVFGPAPWLAERGVTFYAYDQRGFGHAPDRGGFAGADAMADDLACIARLVGAAHPGVPVHLLGQSMGAAVVVLAMTAPAAPSVAGVILAAPGLRDWGASSWFQRAAMRLAAWARPNGLLPAEAKSWKGTDNEALEKAFDVDPVRLHETRLATVPALADLMTRARASAPRIRTRTLLLHGARDEAIPLRFIEPVVREMRARNVPLAFACYPDGWHSLLNGLDRETVWRDILSWIADPEAPLPSGADTRRERAGPG